MSTVIGRRQFLITSSAAIATAAVSPKLFAGEAGGALPKRLSVGFAPIEETANVFAASRLTSGDGAFISRGARISASGSSGTGADPGARRAVELVAHYSYFDGSERRAAPFRAWGCSRNTGCQGSPVSFTVPVDDTQRIVFSVAVEQGREAGTPTSRRRAAGPATSDLTTAELPVVLSVMSDDSLKLVRGFYVIVPLFDNDRDPRWSDYELKTRDGRWALTGRDGEPAPFEHFVLRIDYAS